ILSLPNLMPGAEARTLVGAAATRYTQAEIPSARTAVMRAMQLAHDAGDTEAAVYGEIVSAHVERAAGNEEIARDRFARAVDGFLTLGIPWGAANALGGMAAVALTMGDNGEAERLLGEVSAMRGEVGAWFTSVARRVGATLALQRGNPDEAIAFVREDLAEIRKLQDKFAFVSALVPLAAAAALKGDDAWAARILGARAAVSERTGAAIADRSVQTLKDRTEEEVRVRLGPEKWARAYAAGRNASIDALINDIDRAL